LFSEEIKFSKAEMVWSGCSQWFKQFIS